MYQGRSSALPLQIGVVAIEKGAFGLPSTMVANFTLLYIYVESKLPPPPKYNECNGPAEEQDSPNECPVYDTKQSVGRNAE